MSPRTIFNDGKRTDRRIFNGTRWVKVDEAASATLAWLRRDLPVSFGQEKAIAIPVINR